MGRDVTGIRFDKKSNAAATVSGGLNEEEQDVLGVKSTNREPGPQNSTEKKSSLPIKSPSPSAVNETSVVETNASALESSIKSNDLNSPKSDKKSQPNSPSVSRKHNDDDNCSMASSTATSRTTIPKVTVPVAPKFTCVDRLERRKEFYTKLEEKHKALEKERLEYEARTKEEEQAAIKQLRKSMTYKANPIPNFYRDGPPPKVELKKAPVTRAKSPNLTRRKSFGDAVVRYPSSDDKGVGGQSGRLSVGVYKVVNKNSPITPKSSKDRIGVRTSNGSKKVKDRSSENSKVKEEESGEDGVEW